MFTVRYEKGFLVEDNFVLQIYFSSFFQIIFPMLLKWIFFSFPVMAE